MQPVKRLALFLLLLAGASRSNAQAWVQSALCNASFSGSATCQQASNATGGNAYIAFFYSRAGTSSDTMTISDNNSDTWVQPQVQGDINMVGGQSVTMGVAYACNILTTPNAKPTFTVTNNHGGSAIWAYIIQEIDTMKTSCYDQSAQNVVISGSTVTPWSGPTITPTWTKTIHMAFTFTNASSFPTNQSPFVFRGNFALQDVYEAYLYTGTSAVTPQFISTSGSITKGLQVSIDLISSAASPAGGGAARHKLLMSLLPAIPFLWERGWIPVAIFRRRRELLEISGADR
jgi:hypothetical protein